MLYRLSGVAKAYGPKEVLKDATWQHDPGRIVGLVGRNGAGKSTVLRIVQGLVEPDAGKLHTAGGTTFASLDQAVEPEGDEPLRAFVARALAHLVGLEDDLRRLEEGMAQSSADTGLEDLLSAYDEARERFEREGGYEAESRVERVLSGVGLPREVWDRPVGELSGGQKHRAQIARLLLTSASVLLLDEPTNHLDVAGIEFLETWLRERSDKAGLAALVVSHDRKFLNSVADRIVEVALGRLEEYPGDYDTYRKLKAERDRVRRKAYAEQREMIERTEDFIRRNIAGQKTKQARGRRKLLARLERVDAPEEDANDVTFRFEEQRASGERVLESKALVPGYPETGALLAPVSMLLRRGDRVALWGPNGCGKTTLLKTLARVLAPISGSVQFGTGVLVGYYDQEMADLSPASTLLDTVMDLDPSMKEPEARDFLAIFDFRGDEVFQKIGTLSGGEKGRLSIARIVFGGANLLLLDEPTNHLDLDAREQLEDALTGFEGAIVFVSHDRWFVDRLATQVLEVKDGTATLHDGNYTDLVKRRVEGGKAERAAAVSAPSKAPTLSDISHLAHGLPPKGGTGKRDKAVERKRLKAGKRLEELEDEIARMEESIRGLDETLATPEVVREGGRVKAILAQKEHVKKELEARMAEWEELSLLFVEEPQETSA